MNTTLQWVKGLWHLPSAWLLILQTAMLLLSALAANDLGIRAIIWMLGALALLVIAKVIKASPVFSILGLFSVSGALIFSLLILLGYHHDRIQMIAHGFEAVAYFSAAYALLKYMFADRYVTKDELFAAAAVFTLIAWGFAFCYNICQLYDAQSFAKNGISGMQSWLDLLFLSFSLQSATGLSDIFPVTGLARVVAMLQMFAGVMYFALIVSRLIAMQYIARLPSYLKHQDDTDH